MDNKEEKISNQIKDMLHKQISKLVSTLYEAGVQTVAVGDLNGIRKSMNYGKKENQKLHAWAFGQITSMIIYKCKLLGMKVELINEAYTSKICPNCGKKNKLGLGERIYQCECGYINDRDVKSALCIENEAMKNIPTEHRDFKMQESSANTFFNLLNKIDSIKVSKQDSLNARSPRL